MAAELDGARAKLDRAREQLNALSAEIGTFLNGEPFASFVDIDDERREIAVGIEVRQKPSLAISVVIGEILHDLRSALDHALWQLVIHDGALPHDRTGFPIYRTLTGFDNERRATGRRQGMLVGLSVASIAVVTAMQPFSTEEDADSPLWYLHELHNFDKHRTLILAAAQIQALRVSLGPLAAATYDRSAITGDPGPYEDDAIIYRQPIPNWFLGEPEVNVDTPATYGLAFGKETPPSVAGAEVIGILGIIGKRVHTCVEEIDALF